MKRLLSFSLLAFVLAAALASCTKTPVELTAPTISSVVPAVNTAEVSWNAVDNATSYTVQLRTVGGEWSTAKTSTSTSATVDGLSPKTEYEVRVQAEGGEGFSTSPFSSAYKFTTLEAGTAKLDTPVITGVTPSAKSAEVAWNPVANASSYALQIRPTAGEWADAGTSATPPATVSGLIPQTEYEVRVKASGSGVADSDYSEAFKFTTTEVSVSYPLTIETADDFVFWINEKASSCQVGDLITLGADLDLAGKTLTPVVAFYGTLDGNGKTLKNLTLTNALFELLEEGGVVKNLNVDSGSSITWTAEIPDMTGISFIASKSKGSVIGCSVAGSIKVTSATAGRIYCAGVVGESESGYVEGCKFSGNIDVDLSTSQSCSGIAGVVARIGKSERADEVIAKNCENEGKIKFVFSGASGGMKKFGIGGVIGQTPSVANAPNSHGIIENCVNKGEIEWQYPEGGSGSYPALGGVVGIVEGQLRGASNYGKITYIGGKKTAVTDASIGGVAGYVTGNASDCHNYGSINIDSAFAGGTSMAQSGGNTSFSTFGGVFGNAGPFIKDATYAGDLGVVVENCSNEADVDITCYMVTTGGPQMCFGGVIGASTANMKNCTNNKSVTFNTQTKTVNAGGVVGYLEADIEDCTNNGAVTVNGHSADHPKDISTQVYLGGVFGMITKTSTVKSVKNTAAVTMKDVFTTPTALSYVGGINGSYKGGISMTGAENSGTVKVDSPNPICLGGVSGAINGDIRDCKNSGKVEYANTYVSVGDGTDDKKPEVGGFSGYANATFTGCSNTGTVSSQAPDGFVSGFVGSFGEADSNWSNCSVNCKVESSATKASALGRFRHAGAYCITLGSEDGPFTVAGDAASLPLLGEANGNSVFLQDYSKKVINYAGKEYKIVKLGDGRWWMASPLAYVPAGKTVSSDPADDSAGIWYTYTINGKNATPSTDNTDGYLYDYATAIGVKTEDLTFKTATEWQEGTYRNYEGVQGICPPGWYIPTRADFLKLVGYSTKDDTRGESAAIDDPSAVYYDAAYKGSKITIFNAAGWNFSFLGARAKNTATGTYNVTVIDASKCSVAEWYGKPAFNQVMSSTAYKPNAGGTNFTVFALMSTFTSTYLDGRLTVTNSNYAQGNEVRCIRKEAE